MTRCTAWTLSSAVPCRRATPSPLPVRRKAGLTAAGDWSVWVRNAGGTSLSDTRTHNNLHALTVRNVNGVPGSLSYDANWNQADDTFYKYAYDANDQLQKVTDPGTLALVASYAYDGFGRRTQRFVASSSATTTYFYNREQVVQEFPGGVGKLAAYYTYGEGIDERITMCRSNKDYYYHANRLGSTYLLSDGSGSVLERYSYTPNGVVTVYDSMYGSPGKSSSAGNPYLYTGRELDPEAGSNFNGTYNYRARTYDPILGRFKQLDPVGLYGGANLYLYVGDSPLVAMTRRATSPPVPDHQ